MNSLTTVLTCSMPAGGMTELEHYLRQKPAHRIISLCTFQEALLILPLYRPTLAVVTNYTGDHMGLRLIRQIRRISPATYTMVLLPAEPKYFPEALLTNADGYLPPQAGGSEFEECFTQITQGFRYLGAHLQERLNSQHEQLDLNELTEEQLRILKGIAKGQTNYYTARQLGVSPLIVQKHKYRLIQMLGLPNTAALTAYAVRAYDQLNREKLKEKQPDRLLT